VTLLSRAIAHARSGPRVVAAKLRRRLDPGTKVLCLFGLTEPRSLPVEAARAGAHTFRFASVEDLQRDMVQGRWPWTPADVKRLEEGARCLLQLDGDQLVGYTWASVTSPTLLTEGVYLSLPPDVGYIYKALTRPEYRGAGFQPLRTLELLRHLKAEGRRRLLCYVEDTNVESLHGIRKSGYVRIGTVRIVRGRSRFHTSITIDDEFWADLRSPRP
jgi:ribosomal protein S18 acetylase RimI-like enzyme